MASHNIPSVHYIGARTGVALGARTGVALGLHAPTKFTVQEHYLGVCDQSMKRQHAPVSFKSS